MAVSNIGFAQEKTNMPLKVGDRFPDYRFSEVAHFKSKSTNINSFKGKWLLLSFWNRYCSVCIKKMPQEDSLQREFKDKVQFLLVGYTGSQYTGHSDERFAQQLYERVRNTAHLNLAVAFDSTLFHKLDIATCPYIFVIDPKGIIRGITISVSRSDLIALINDKQAILKPAYTRTEWRARALQKEKAGPQ